ncbi:unnamed protein product [Cunninghamella blakesleeana]
MKLIIESTNLTNPTEMEVDEELSMKELKDQLEEIVQIKPHMQEIHYNGDRMTNDMVLKELKIINQPNNDTYCFKVTELTEEQTNVLKVLAFLMNEMEKAPRMTFPEMFEHPPTYAFMSILLGQKTLFKEMLEGCNYFDTGKPELYDFLTSQAFKNYLDHPRNTAYFNEVGEVLTRLFQQ